jgi:hypothetical protein
VTDPTPLRLQKTIYLPSAPCGIRIIPFLTQNFGMKKFYTSLKNENVQAAVIIGSVFLITGLVALIIILNQAV